MLNCRDATELSSRLMDDKLSTGRRISLRLHLMICYLCRRYLKQVRLIREAVHRMDEELDRYAEALDIRLSPEARERIRATLNER